jgi:hypothetical protein
MLGKACATCEKVAADDEGGCMEGRGLNVLDSNNGSERKLCVLESLD